MKNTKAPTVGQLLEMEMIKPIKGNMPIGRHNGLVCLLVREKKPGYYEYGSSWQVEVVEVHEKKLIVKPTKLLINASDNESIKAALLGKLVTKKPERKGKPKVNYPYLRAGETK